MTVTELKATQVLNDCQRSLDSLESVPDGDAQLFRIFWTFCLVSLRSVEDALIKFDIKQFPMIKPRLEKRHAELMALKKVFSEKINYEDCDNEDYLIYHRLVHGERNSVVHDVSQSYVDGMWSLVGDKELVNWGNTYLPMWDFDKWGFDDCREWMQRGINWWRKELAELTKDIA